ncbi:hypothetical protein ABT237_14975 [Streptomyces sp. NPDC001581]|uniref:hypothetical protein n=1 Tax=Streptomyces sp. NPDC001581 TaxID=3154386 RepID=UPI003319CEEC
MAQPVVPPAQVCLACDGFPAVAVTLGGRDRAGARRTITAHCPACHGTGIRRPQTTTVEVQV